MNEFTDLQVLYLYLIALCNGVVLGMIIMSNYKNRE